ncbi:glutaredoxin-like YruB-family protein [Sporomusaceae bacterium BoRhaA]|uniref:glutaredoxin domain-containing protein n=1 Tax=Pelorhabdus rhamnosifermentans TaxID=2772457 RepID=UPI001C0635B7|nr:glutaredoxin domain-containing protein [Pelorhabdus rhamnosifermentans]MBU2700073.1 glutaredoxin-like YruB-family protein [Pelorhabdus rhamnosifermentans]
MVKVYTINGCSWCEKTKSYLAQKGVNYIEVNVEDVDGLKELMTISGQQSVPVLDIGGKVVIGFDRSKIDEYLRLVS